MTTKNIVITAAVLILTFFVAAIIIIGLQLGFPSWGEVLGANSF
jgi:hypothetical protein